MITDNEITLAILKHPRNRLLHEKVSECLINSNRKRQTDVDRSVSDDVIFILRTMGLHARDYNYSKLPGTKAMIGISTRRTA